jgi:beta-glucosidase
MAQHSTRSKYLDPTCPVDERTRDLFSRLTLDEKLAQLGSVWVFQLFEETTFSQKKAEQWLSHGIGQITRIGGASNLNPVASAELANTIQSFLINTTPLGIPAIVHEECCSGYMALGATIFPQTLGVASTWEPELVEALAAVIRTQMRAVGGHQALAPVLDVVRDPRWGRVEETLGEDPYLVSRMGSAYIRSLQGTDLREGILATAKHFVAHGASEGGMNWAPPHVPPRELLEVFVAPFEAAIKTAGLASIMPAYHEMDGVPVHRSEELMRDLLRTHLQFEGLVVSDYFGIDMLAEYHGVARNQREAAALALRAGIDVELPNTNCYGDPLREALEAGIADMALVDAAVGKVLETKFRLGLFEKPYVDTGRVLEVFETPEQRALARQIAQKTMVLLKNEGHRLPLSKESTSLAVIGPNADSTRNLLGDYTYPAHVETLIEAMKSNPLNQMVPESISMVEQPVPMISILQAIREKVSAGTQVRYAKGCDVIGDSTEGFAEAVEVARQSEIVIMMMGDKAGLTDDCTCGETRDRAEIGLPGVQEQLLRAVYAVGRPVVLVLINGRPLSLPWVAEHIPAIVEAWLPGEEGARAVADVLFGDCNPGGRLPMTFPRAVGQIPVYYSHKPSGGRSHWKGDYVELTSKPLYPFGHGLSYTQFEYSGFRMNTQQARAGETVAVSVDVANTGSYTGDEVVQLYIHNKAASVTRPVKELKGFKRITLEPGECRTITFHLAVNQFAFYGHGMQFVVEPGQIEIMIGSSSTQIHWTGMLQITGETTSIDSDKAFFSTVEEIASNRRVETPE